MPVTVCNYVVNPAAGGKFVVLMPEERSAPAIVAFSDFGRDFQHRDIVTRWERGNRATLAGRGLRVAGGGWWKYEGDRLLLYGQSGDYGRFDPAWLRGCFAPGMLFHEKTVDVR